MADDSSEIVREQSESVAATNLVTFTGYKGIDPDVSHFGQSPLEYGVDFDGYPKAKQFLLSIQVGL